MLCPKLKLAAMLRRCRRGRWLAREEIEARNTADSIAYQEERQVSELGDHVPMNERARAEQLILQIQELVKTNSTDVAQLRQLTSDLQQSDMDSLPQLPARTIPAASGPEGGHPARAATMM